MEWTPYPSARGLDDVGTGGLEARYPGGSKRCPRASDLSEQRMLNRPSRCVGKHQRHSVFHHVSSTVFTCGHNIFFILLAPTGRLRSVEPRVRSLRRSALQIHSRICGRRCRRCQTPRRAKSDDSWLGRSDCASFSSAVPAGFPPRAMILIL